MILSSPENKKTKAKKQEEVFCPYCRKHHPCTQVGTRKRKCGEYKVLPVFRCSFQEKKAKEAKAEGRKEPPKMYFTKYSGGYVEYSRKPLVNVPDEGIGLTIYDPNEEQLLSQQFEEMMKELKIEDSTKSPYLIYWRNTVSIPVITRSFGAIFPDVQENQKDELGSSKDKRLKSIEDLIDTWKVGPYTRNSQKMGIERLFQILFEWSGKKDEALEIPLREEIPTNGSISPSITSNIKELVGRGRLTLKAKALCVTKALASIKPSKGIWQELRILWRMQLPKFNELSP